MALTEDIQIYKSMYKLLQKLIEARGNFDKGYKYIIGDELIRTAMQCVIRIRYANEDRRKGARAEHLDEFLIQFGILKTLTMVCRDGRQFKKPSVLGDVFLLIADVETQATAWRRSAVRKPESE